MDGCTERATILVVEDDLFVRMLATDVLEDAGWKVLDAGDGVEALAILGEHPEVSLIFTDINMPEMDGFTLARKALSDRPDVRLILSSGRARYDEEELPDDGKFLPKPYTPSALVELVRRELATH